MFRILSLVLIKSHLIFASPLERAGVKTGVVPIFDSRITNEPITFTFTTQEPNKVKPTVFPTLRPNTYVSFEPVLQNNINSFNVNEKWQNLQSLEKTNMDIKNTIKQNKMTQYPIYNQAQYYKAIQSLTQQILPPSSANYERSLSDLFLKKADYSQIWNQIKTSWQQVNNKMQDSLRRNGAESDWRQLWQKLSGAFEPFMSQFSEQIGRAMNIFLKSHQNNHHRKQSITNELTSKYEKEDEKYMNNPV